jgi:hypothetical protein
MMITQEYEIILINIKSGVSMPLGVYRISDIVYESSLVGGLCLLFDKDKELIDVLASTDMIVEEALDFIGKDHSYYALVYDDENKLEEWEIEEIFDMIQSGAVNIVVSQPVTLIQITMGSN